MWTPRSFLLIGWLAASAGCSGDTHTTGPNSDDDPYPYPVGKVFFTHPPIGLEGVVYFESMGALDTPYQEDHGGFVHLDMFEDEPTIPVIAPADGQVIEIRTHEGTINGVEHAIRLKVSTTIELLWGHVGRLSDRLASKAPPVGTGRDVRIPVDAGEVIAYVAKQALDLGINDTDIETSILHPEFIGVSPYAAPLEDYYQEPLRSEITALALREAEPRTGKMGYDVAGTLSGLWYLEGSDPRAEFRYDIAFHFGYHHLLPHRTHILDGLAFDHVNTGWGGISLWTFWVKQSPRWEEITPSSQRLKLEMYTSRSGRTGSWPDWTLQDTSGLDEATLTVSILLVEMLDDDTIRLERFDATGDTGISPDDVAGFTENARTYHRNPVG